MAGNSPVRVRRGRVQHSVLLREMSLPPAHARVVSGTLDCGGNADGDVGDPLRGHGLGYTCYVGAGGEGPHLRHMACCWRAASSTRSQDAQESSACSHSSSSRSSSSDS